MKRIALVSLIILVGGILPIFSQDLSESLRSNRYYLESLRLTDLAQESYDLGDYDASTNYAAEALKYAQLSDEYVALQLKMKEVDDAIAAAKGRIDWAVQAGADRTNPAEYGAAEQAHDEAVAFRSDVSWDEAIAAAQRAIDALAYVTGEPVFPAQYTVRPWASTRDCLWNIAGRPWVYGDPRMWRLLYEANKAKLPDPNNPDLIEPGMVLDIPSIRGERREGLWSAGAAYEAIRRR